MILFVVAALCAGVASAGYPDDYFGPPLPDGCIEIEAYMPDGWFLDRNPWSMPSPEETIFWFGTLCVEGSVAVLEFTALAGRHCREAPWGVIGDPPICYSWHLVDIRDPDRHVMAWDPDFEPDWGFYLASVHAGEWIWFYESLTADPDGTHMIFTEGAFEYVQPLWFVESDDYTRWKFLVTERSTPMFGYRRSAERRR
jgi:hypothetical protein